MSFADYYTVNGVSDPVMLKAIKTNLSEILDTPQTNNQKLTNELGRKNIENTLNIYEQKQNEQMVRMIKLNLNIKKRMSSS